VHKSKQPPHYKTNSTQTKRNRNAHYIYMHTTKMLLRLLLRLPRKTWY